MKTMEPIYVQATSHKYPIYIGEHIRFNISQYFKKNYSSAMIVTDENVAHLYLNDIKQSITNMPVFETIIPSGEQAKQLQVFYDIQTKAIEDGLDRQSVIIALGGGVVGDVAGFVAATFMRGIDYIQMPTTILAHDSSVGGKVAINHELGKNLIGSFYPPVSVVYDIHTLQTLPFSEIRSGYAEIMKEAMLADCSLVNKLLELNLRSITKEQLYSHLYTGISIKKAIVIRDEKESNERMYLNLGHTLGHAIESADQYRSFLHGEAVAIGLLFAVFISEQHYPIDLTAKKLIHWLKTNNFPLNLNSYNITSLLINMKKDKKVIDDEIRFVLLKQIGQPTVQTFSVEQIGEYLNEFINRFF